MDAPEAREEPGDLWGVKLRLESDRSVSSVAHAGRTQFEAMIRDAGQPLEHPPHPTHCSSVTAYPTRLATALPLRKAGMNFQLLTDALSPGSVQS